MSEARVVKKYKLRDSQLFVVECPDGAYKRLGAAGVASYISKGLLHNASVVTPKSGRANYIRILDRAVPTFKVSLSCEDFMRLTAGTGEPLSQEAGREMNFLSKLPPVNAGGAGYLKVTCMWHFVDADCYSVRSGMGSVCATMSSDKLRDLIRRGYVRNAKLTQYNAVAVGGNCPIYPVNNLLSFGFNGCDVSGKSLENVGKTYIG